MTDAAFWDKIAPKYAQDPISDMAGYVETRDRIATLLEPAHRVLEIGCGTGSTAIELAPAVDRYVGTDVSPAMIEIARASREAQSLAHLSFVAQQAADMPKGPFDAVLALNLLHLLTDAKAVLAAAHAALPPGGLFIAKTPLLRDGPFYVRWMIPPMRWIGKAPRVRSFAQGELLAMIEHAGFEIEETLLQPGVVPRVFTVARRR